MGLATNLISRAKDLPVQISWTDSEGDSVTITNDESLGIALQEMSGPLFKIAVSVSAEDAHAAKHKAEHEAAHAKAVVGEYWLSLKLFTCSQYHLSKEEQAYLSQN